LSIIIVEFRTKLKKQKERFAYAMLFRRGYNELFCAAIEKGVLP